MNKTILNSLMTIIMLTALVACNGNSNSPLGKLPDIMADACHQQEQIEQQAKSGDSNVKESFSKALETIRAAQERIHQEGERLKGQEIPSTGGMDAYDYIKIEKVVIDDVDYHNGRNNTCVTLQFVPSQGYNSSSMPKGSSIYYVFLDKDNNKIESGKTYNNAMSIKINLGNMGNSSPEQWRGLKQIKFLTKEQYQSHSY